MMNIWGQDILINMIYAHDNHYMFFFCIHVNLLDLLDLLDLLGSKERIHFGEDRCTAPCLIRSHTKLFPVAGGSILVAYW